MEITADEARAIAALKRVAKRWPESLWLFSGSGTLHVMKHNDEGERARTQDGGADPDFAIATIDISNDGGDW